MHLVGIEVALHYSVVPEAHRHQILPVRRLDLLEDQHDDLVVELRRQSQLLEPALLVPEAKAQGAGRARRLLRRRLGCRSLCRRG
eukprot:2095686-Prymnesium_polylepis.1